jgi:hypothetical protein
MRFVKSASRSFASTRVSKRAAASLVAARRSPEPSCFGFCDAPAIVVDNKTLNQAYSDELNYHARIVRWTGSFDEGVRRYRDADAVTLCRHNREDP